MRFPLTKHFSSPRRRWQILVLCIVLIVINLTSSMVYQNHSKSNAPVNTKQVKSDFLAVPDLQSLVEPKTVSYHEIPPEIAENNLSNNNEDEVETETSTITSADEKLPEIVNPWFDLGSNKTDPLEISQDDFENASLNSCDYRRFKNASVYGQAEFIHEYIDFRKCILENEKSRLDQWIRSNLKAELGVQGEMVITTKFKITENNMARKCQPDEEIRLLITCFSKSPLERDNIRRTWGKTLPSHVKLIFITHSGDYSQEENLIQSKVDPDDEDYEFKQMLIILAWVNQNCPRARFVLKTSSDIFVNLPKMLQLVDQEMYASNRMYGELLRRMGPAWPEHVVSTKHAHHHAIAKSSWPWPKFPPILKGPSYIISGDLVPRILMAATVIPALPLPQVFFTGLVPLLGHMMRIGVASFFTYDPPSKDTKDICDYYKFGGIHGISDFESMNLALEKVEEAVVRNETCAVPPRCLAMVEGKCMMFSKSKQPKKNAFNWP